MLYKSVVITGNQLGRKIGFPTFNLSLDNLELNLEYGVYAALVEFNGLKKIAAMHFGPRKSVDNLVSLEFHVLDYDDFEMKVDFIVFKPLKFIRPVVEFSSLKDLEKQIKLDLQRIKSFEYES